MVFYSLVRVQEIIGHVVRRRKRFDTDDVGFIDTVSKFLSLPMSIQMELNGYVLNRCFIESGDGVA